MRGGMIDGAATRHLCSPVLVARDEERRKAFRCSPARHTRGALLFSNKLLIDVPPPFKAKRTFFMQQILLYRDSAPPAFGEPASATDPTRVDPLLAPGPLSPSDPEIPSTPKTTLLMEWRPCRTGSTPATPRANQVQIWPTRIHPCQKRVLVT